MRDFGSILGGPGGSKNQLKIEKIAFGTVLERVWDAVSILGTILDRFLWILQRFGVDFGRILEGFQEDFWKDLFDLTNND